MKRVIIAGMGPGSKSCITEEVKAAIDNAEIIIGSKRLIEEYPDKKTFYAVTADNIVSIIERGRGTRICCAYVRRYRILQWNKKACRCA